ncbi:MAG: pilus assembly protein PilM [Gammaproteobacteria bacterium]|nr:pilus assembly protein PilM [Gammaproteobacteria bacterium]
MLGGRLQQQKQVGLYLTTDGIAVAAIEQSGDKLPVLKSCAFIPSTESADQLIQLARYIRANNLKKQSCVVVLEEAQYNLIQLSSPPVADDELRSAVRWGIKDLVNYPVEDAVIDVFRVPVQGHREGKIYVVAALKDEIQKTVDFIRKTGLKLHAIDIEELSLGNIIEQMSDYQRGVAVLYVGNLLGSINLFSNSALYLSRKIDTGLSALEEVQKQGASSEAMEQVYESIILELQRSLDFYESQFSRPAITKLVIAPGHPVLQGFCDYASNHTGLSVELINLAQVYTDSTELDDENQASCLLAIAAAARKVEVVA